MVLCGLPSSPALLSSRNLPSNSNHRSWVLPPSPQHLQCLLRLPYHHILRFLHCCLLVHVLSVSCNCGDASIISHLTRSCSSSVASNIAHSAALPSSVAAPSNRLHESISLHPSQWSLCSCLDSWWLVTAADVALPHLNSEQPKGPQQLDKRSVSPQKIHSLAYLFVFISSLPC